MDFLRLSVLSEFSPFYISFLFPGRPAHVPNCHRYAEKIPNGCFIKPDKALLARSRNNAISQDPVLNFFFATTAISYILPSLLMILMAILLRTTRWTQVCVAKLQGFWREKNPCCSSGRKAEPVLQAGDRPLRVVHRHQVAGGDLLLHRPDPHQPAVRHRQQAP